MPATLPPAAAHPSSPMCDVCGKIDAMKRAPDPSLQPICRCSGCHACVTALLKEGGLRLRSGGGLREVDAFLTLVMLAQTEWARLPDGLSGGKKSVHDGKVPPGKDHPLRLWLRGLMRTAFNAEHVEEGRVAEAPQVQGERITWRSCFRGVELSHNAGARLGSEGPWGAGAKLRKSGPLARPLP